MKKIHIILLVLIGFLIMPISTVACGTISKKSCCQSEIKNSGCKMKCCQKKSKNKSNKGCEGKCGKSTCQVQTVSFIATLPNFSEIKNNYYFFSTSRQCFFNQETNISDGYYFIWSPPNIC